jgi:hypothetical protein
MGVTGAPDSPASSLTRLTAVVMIMENDRPAGRSAGQIC